MSIINSIKIKFYIKLSKLNTGSILKEKHKYYKLIKYKTVVFANYEKIIKNYLKNIEIKLFEVPKSRQMKYFIYSNLSLSCY